jgi:hypothetical protein
MISTSAPWEPIWLLDCALAMWAILHFLPDIASSASPDRSGRSLIKCEAHCLTAYITNSDAQIHRDRFTGSLDTRWRTHSLSRYQLHLDERKRLDRFHWSARSYALGIGKALRTCFEQAAKGSSDRECRWREINRRNLTGCKPINSRGAEVVG